MITPMTKYSFVLLNGEQNGLLEKIQEVGLVDITRSSKPMDDNSHALAGEIDLLDGLIQGIRKAEVPEGTQPVVFQGEGADDIVRLAGGTLMLFAESQDKVKTLEKQVRDLKVWGSFDSAIVSKLAEAGVPMHFHIVSPKSFQETWAQEYALSVISRNKDGVYFVVAGEDALPGEVSVPKEDWRELEARLRGETAALKDLEGEIVTLKERLPELEQMRAQAYAKLDLYLAGTTAVPAAEDTIVTLVGYSPAENSEAVEAALDATGSYYLKEAAVVEDNPPIKLKNNWFVRQFEVLTDMYGRPGYDGFDPTPFISVFFLLFFAFCMGDCGYGLILVIIGLLLKKVDSFKDMAPLVVILGIGTTVIGFLFHTFFSLDISTWSIFAPIKGIFLPAKIAGYDGPMVLSIVVGIIHLCLAMCVKTYEQTKNKGFVNSLGTWGWTLLIVGGVIVGSLALVGVLDKELTKWIVIVLGVLSALGIFVFNDMKRNKLANVGMGLWDTYNTATGLLGDVLSYLRLYALGLAGSMLGMAFNNIGQMVLGDGSNAVLWIPFVLIVVIGHTLNIAMAALGAFVHPLRLNFLEFFKNSGYEATGRNFNPLSK
ncbi:MAG: ATPase V [Bacteroidales bacterium]|nr:ATPase V [Bacteroidales bacterium]